MSDLKHAVTVALTRIEVFNVRGASKAQTAADRKGD
jgi:hypothetical protein